MRVKLKGLYRSHKGIWRYDRERDGKISWSSLGTRDERKARRLYAELIEIEGRRAQPVKDEA